MTTSYSRKHKPAPIALGTIGRRAIGTAERSSKSFRRRVRREKAERVPQRIFKSLLPTILALSNFLRSDLVTLSGCEGSRPKSEIPRLHLGMTAGPFHATR